MTLRAWVFILVTIGIGVALCAYGFLQYQAEWLEWMTFAVLVILATLSQLFKALFESKQGDEDATTSYSPTLIFMFAGALLLSPALFVLLVIIPHLIEWVNERIKKSANLPAWYIQPFNIATHIIAGLGAAFVYRSLYSAFSFTLSPLPMIVAALTALVYVAINHALIGQALVLARGVSWRESGVWSRDNVVSDVIMTSLGFAVAVLWTLNPWLILPALAPLILIQRSLLVPQLKQEARVDIKTGLWNVRHFSELFSTELERSRRFGRSLAVIMADLDLLRNINNSYGHMAGDEVLKTVGLVIRNTIREYDIAGRFGGEEFAIVLPEVTPNEARSTAERLRQEVENTAIRIETNASPIFVTLSLGISFFPTDASTTQELIHLADIAVYQAKLLGRNRSVWGADVPHALHLQDLPSTDDAEPSYPAALLPYHSAGATGETPSSSRQTAKPAESKTDTNAGGISLPQIPMPVFLGGVIAAAVAVTLFGLFSLASLAPMTIALVLGLAVLAEVLKVTVYEDNNVSVSVAIVFMAALLTGIPGVVLVSAAIALVHYLQMKPRWYKSVFNWATHTVAGTASLVILHWMPEVTLANILFLIVPTLAAALVYYVIETGLIATAISLSKSQKILATWRTQFGWLGGQYLTLAFMGLCLVLAYTSLGLTGIAVFTLPVFIISLSQRMYVERTKRSVTELKRMNTELSTANAQIETADIAIHHLNEELFVMLGKIIDARDPFVHNHAAQVATYAEAIGEQMGLGRERLAALRQAAALHDIGKLAVKDSILQKPDKLTDDEYELVKKHPLLGASFLESTLRLRGLAPFVRHHHEHWDGTGYPDHLRGEEIPLEARILALCDAVEAMSSDRPYHAGSPLSETLLEIKRCSGTQFDPAVVAAFISVVESHRSEFVINTAERTMVAREIELGAAAMLQTRIGRLAVIANSTGQ